MAVEQVNPMAQEKLRIHSTRGVRFIGPRILVPFQIQSVSYNLTKTLEIQDVGQGGFVKQHCFLGFKTIMLFWNELNNSV